MDEAQAAAVARVMSSPLFPFDTDGNVKALIEPKDHEIVREGEGDRPCRSCDADERMLWRNERWKITPLPPTVNPVGLFLETVDHIDFDHFDADLAAEFGVLGWQLERAIDAVDAVGRVHIHRWGDGSAHFHVWFQGRPAGQVELYGWGNVLWPQVLPALPADEIAAHHATIIERIHAEVGGTISE